MDDEVGILLSQINTEINILIAKVSVDPQLKPAHTAIIETAVKIDSLIRDYADKAE